MATKTDVVKELARMVYSACRLAVKLAATLVLLVIPMHAAIYAVQIGFPMMFADAVTAGIEVVPNIVWTALQRMMQILGLLIMAKLVQEVWFIARERAEERDVNE